MAVQRTDIEKALNELISNEEGMKFQGLAVVLAKQKWPELIACERKSDLGLDAHANGVLAGDGIGKGLACSLTATLPKVKKDAESIKKNYADVSVLIFATARIVTKKTERKWAEEIHKGFDYELVVIPREEIVLSLLEPSNTSLCHSFLGIAVPIEAEAKELVERARAATGELTEAWLEHPRRAGRPNIDLRAVKLDHQGNETEEITDLEGIRASLLEARRIVLEAPAGRGKTTTLLQLAKQSGLDELAFLIDLPDWAKSRLNILDYVAQMRFFQSRAIDAGDLAKLYEVQRFSFLLNGWNEISEDYSEDAVVALRTLERDYPGAGICLATRTRHITPPLPGASRAKLLPLIRAQRNEYLRLSLGSQADELGETLDNNPILDELTRTPFILSVVTDIFRSGGTIPATRIGVLRETIRLLEEAEEHRNHLHSDPLRGHVEDYLAELAMQMTGQSATRVSEREARSIASSVSTRLRDDGQIASLPEPALVLNALCDHHVLERLNYQPDTLSFEHQQFQELYAALRLRRCLSELVEADNKDWDREFAKDYVNDPKWEEPLRMIAEEIGVLSLAAAGGVELALGKRLVEVALTVDPIFAAELSRLSGGLVWKEVRIAVGERLRSWYNANDENHRQCALAGMLASGSDDFADIILPLLTSNDSQVRLGTYRAGTEFHPTTLGRNWRTIVNSWSEKARAEFVSELALHGSNIDRFAVIDSFALTDPSPKVRAEACHGLIWTGLVRVLPRVLEALDDEAFEQVAQELDARSIPRSVRPRALAAWQRLLEKSTNPASRLEILLETAELGEAGIPEKLKNEFTKMENGKVGELGGDLEPALRILGKADEEWASHWVANRILDGSLWSEQWISLVTTIPEGLKAELLYTIGNQELKKVGRPGIIPVLTATADPSVAEAAWARLFAVRRAIFAAGDALSETERAIARQLEDLILALPPDVGIAGLLKCLASQIDFTQFKTVIEVFTRASNASELRSELQDDLRHSLRGYLKNGVALVLSQDDYNGQLKAYLATALGQVGEPEDITELCRLLRADIERVKKGRAASVRRQLSPLAQGAGICWARWHVRALISLDPRGAEEVLLELLCETDYERYENEAASALVELATTTKAPDRFGHKTDYRVVWAARTRNQPARFDEERRECYARAIKQRISILLVERANNAQPTVADHRLKELAKVLADLDGRESFALVMQVMALPGEWDSWIRVEALEALVLSGAELPTKAGLDILNPAIDQIRAQGTSDHNSAWLLVRCLCLLPFFDVPAVGIDRIRQVLSETGLWPSALRDLLGALGASGCEDALPLLLELVRSDGNGESKMSAEWINAVATLSSPKAQRVLMSFIEPEDDKIQLWDIERDHGEGEVLASRIVELSREDDLIKERISQLCDVQLPTKKRLLISKVIARLGTADAVLAGLNLIDDNGIPPIPYDLRQAIETVFIERRPYKNKGSYTLVARSSNEISKSNKRLRTAIDGYTLVGRSSNEIRAKLFEMSLTDVRRKQSAFALLGQIEVWRLEHGRPSSEPRHPAVDSIEPWPPIKAAS